MSISQTAVNENSSSGNKSLRLENYLINQLYTLSFISNAFFNSASVLLNFFMNWVWNLAQVLFNTYNHHYNELFFIFSIFISMSRPAIPYINCETNPPSPMINVVCKYLRKFLGTSFGVTTLPKCYNIE